MGLRNTSANRSPGGPQSCKQLAPVVRFMRPRHGCSSTTAGPQEARPTIVKGYEWSGWISLVRPRASKHTTTKKSWSYRNRHMNLSSFHDRSTSQSPPPLRRPVGGLRTRGESERLACQGSRYNLFQAESLLDRENDFHIGVCGPASQRRKEKRTPKRKEHQKHAVVESGKVLQQ